MSDPTEQDLVEAVGQWLDSFIDSEAMGAYLEQWTWDAESSLVHEVKGSIPELLAALRAALPEGVVLTSDGLARVTEVGGVEWCDDHQGIVDECSSHEGCDLADGEDCRPAALYTLTRIEET